MGRCFAWPRTVVGELLLQRLFHDGLGGVAVDDHRLFVRGFGAGCVVLLMGFRAFAAAWDWLLLAYIIFIDQPQL